ncbi:MAG TPA: hypothetical protein VFY71_18415 [Planctomycetota bacterium]|nr:hypothetical protein [Planctomycetota bacterium]
MGQSYNLRQRTHDHVIRTLGGGYPLYDPDQLAQGRHCERFRPSVGNCNGAFLGDMVSYQQLAAANLRAYEVYWATLDAGQRIRESVEAGLIAALKSLVEYSGTGIHENRPSLNHAYSPSVSVTSVLPSGLTIPHFPLSFSHGQLAE